MRFSTSAIGECTFLFKNGSTLETSIQSMIVLTNLGSSPASQREPQRWIGAIVTVFKVGEADDE